MKKLLFVGALAFCSSAALASDTIKVLYGSGEDRFSVNSVKITSVCGLKHIVANQYDLRISKFDLLKGSGSSKLDENKTLRGAGISSYGTVTVKEVNYSSQCD